MIFLSCYQGEKPDLERHYDLPLTTDKVSKSLKKLIEKKIYKKKCLNPINIMIWNCDSLSNNTKREFLIEYLFTRNIQICPLQETMLKKVINLIRMDSKYIDQTIMNIGKVAILISNELKSLNQITEKDDYNGRFIQAKLTSD